MNLYTYILAMAVTTYLIRMLPLTLLKKPIKNRFLMSFLHYVPTACLTAMTFPAILYATDHILSGAVGLAIGIVVAAIRSTYDKNRESMAMHKGLGYYLLKIGNGICHLYLTVFRGTPIVVQLLIMYFIVFASSRDSARRSPVGRPV